MCQVLLLGSFYIPVHTVILKIVSTGLIILFIGDRSIKIGLEFSLQSAMLISIIILKGDKM